MGLDRFPELHPDVVALEAREPNLEGEGGVSLAELVRWALRMSPDRVIVGEARGEEVLALLNAMSPGHRRVDGHPARFVVAGRLLQAGHLRRAGPRTPAAWRPPTCWWPTPSTSSSTWPKTATAATSPRSARWSTPRGRWWSPTRSSVPAPTAGPCPARRMRNDTLDQLAAVGFDPGLLERPQGWWET